MNDESKPTKVKETNISRKSEREKRKEFTREVEESIEQLFKEWVKENEVERLVERKNNIGGEWVELVNDIDNTIYLFRKVLSGSITNTRETIPEVGITIRENSFYEYGLSDIAETEQLLDNSEYIISRADDKELATDLLKAIDRLTKIKEYSGFIYEIKYSSRMSTKLEVKLTKKMLKISTRRNGLVRVSFGEIYRPLKNYSSLKSTIRYWRHIDDIYDKLENDIEQKKKRYEKIKSNTIDEYKSRITAYAL